MKNNNIEQKKLITLAKKEDLLAVNGIGEKTAHRILAVIANGKGKAEDYVFACGNKSRFEALCSAFCFKTGDAKENAFDKMVRLSEEEKLHLNDEKLLKDMKERKGNAYVQKITLLPEWGYDHKPAVKAKISISAVQITPMNEIYMERNCKLQDSIGNKTITRIGSRKIVIVDAAPIAVIDKLTDKAARYVQRQLFLADIDNRVRVLIPAIVSGKNGYVDISGKPNEFGDRPAFIASDLKKAGVKIHSFAGEDGCNPNTPSQGRKTQITCYENTSRADADLYVNALNEASMGEYALDMALAETVTPKEAADLNTRVSSHMTGMGMTAGQGCRVETYAIMFSADGNTDGRFVLSADSIAKNLFLKHEMSIDEKKLSKLASRVEGYLVQARPYTVKAAGLVESSSQMSLELKGRKLLKINVDTADEEILDVVKMMLSKYRRNHNGIKLGKNETLPESLRGYDGVVICHDDSTTNADIEMIGDLNAFKDQYDLKRIDGVNVLAVAHFDAAKGWVQAYLSAQMNKITLRAVKDAPELSHDATVTFCGIIRRQLDADVDFSAKPHEFGSGMIDTGYVAQVVRDLNPNCIEQFPSVWRSMINDAKLRMENHINLDRYGIAGHSGMLTSDPVYSAWGESVLGVDGDGVVEVYDPVYNRYAKEEGVTDNRGTGIKHPSMKTNEVLLVRYISDKEMERRIRTLGEKLGKEVAEADILISTMRHFKEGGVLLPADLKTIAWIAAGLDLDGDKVIFHFVTTDGLDTVHIIWAAFEAGKFHSCPVCIGNDNEEEKTPINVGATMFSQMQAKMIETRNKSVGSITNAFRILCEGLLSDTDDVKNFFIDMFREVFKAGTEGNSVYEPQVEVKTLDSGLTYLETNTRVLENVEEAIKKMALTWENIQLALNDLDAVGRHVQELTIDAQKKFYTVMCDFLEALNNRCSILPFEAEVVFQMNWSDLNDDAHVTIVENPGYTINDTADKVNYSSLFSVTKGHGNNAHDVFVLADAFAPFRAWAAGAAMKRLNAIRKEYVEKTNDPASRMEWDEQVEAYTIGLSHIVKTQLAHVKQMAFTANHLYANFMSDLRLAHETPNMTKTDLREVENDIRREARSNFNDILANVANQIRIVAEMNGVDPVSLMFAMSSSKDVASGIVGKLLKEEACYFLAARSEVNEARYALRGVSVTEALNLIDSNVNKVHVSKGVIEELGVHVNLMSGEYELRETENGVELTRPLTDYIELPKADFTKLSFQIAGNFVNKIEELPANAEVELHRTKLDKNGRLVDAIGLFYKNEVVAEVMCGSFVRGLATNVQPFNINAKLYDGKVGNLVGMNITKGNAKETRFFIVSLENVKTVKTVEASDEAKNFDVSVSPEEILEAF